MSKLLSVILLVSWPLMAAVPTPPPVPEDSLRIGEASRTGMVVDENGYLVPDVRVFPGQPLFSQAMTTFDGAGQAAGSEQTPISVEDGVALISRTDEITGYGTRGGHERCSRARFDPSLESCHETPLTRVAEHRVTNNYQIVDRGEYADSERHKGAVIGALAGAGVGIVVGVLLALLTGGVAVLPMVLGGAAAGLGGASLGAVAGGEVAQNDAEAKPEEFTETENYTESV
ncbi:MAG: hypothetical protein HY747_08435 [Elusimicrobia bacterium]|nr:hypothetical protein [Elusimicrobiota bacterium]